MNTKAKSINLKVKCPSCNGTGCYQGVGEGEGTAVVCSKCKGTGCYDYSYTYEDFDGIQARDDIERVYLTGFGYKIGLGIINFGGDVPVDMDKEGISYAAFLAGEKPKHIKKLGCPMLADQGACHDIEGFTDRCNKLNGGWLGYIPSCKNKSNCQECWSIFEKVKI